MNGLYEQIDVSRETLEKYCNLVEKWNSRINLISKNSVLEIWTRHIVDSAQIYLIAPTGQKWVDLGSGAGFPGIVCAIMSKDQNDGREFTLVEADQRKATFLRTVIRELNLSAEVISSRVEEIPPLDASIISARALADLDTLLGYCETHLARGGTALLPKGVSWKSEYDTAKKRWDYDATIHNSVTNDASALLEIKEISRA